MARGRLPDLPRRRARGRQDLRHAQRGPAAPRAGHRRRRRARRDPRPRRTPRRRSATSRSCPAARLEYRGPRLRGDGRRRHPGPPAHAGPGRRAGPHQRARAPATRSAGRTSRRSSTPASTSSRPSTSSTSSRSTTWSSGSPASTSTRRSPTRVVRAAEQVELVDMTPEALRRRMAHGNIYPSEQVDAALANYFRPGQPRRAARAGAALGRRPGRRVPPAVHGGPRDRHRRGRPGSGSSSRSPAPQAATMLIRRAAADGRSATRGDLLGVHIRTTSGLAEPRTT